LLVLSTVTAQELVAGYSLTTPAPSAARGLPPQNAAVSQPGFGFVVGGSAFADGGVNGVHHRVREATVPASLAAQHGAFRLCNQNSVTQWLLALLQPSLLPPDPATPLHRRHTLVRAPEWLLLDATHTPRFAAPGPSILPGWGETWRHLVQQTSEAATAAGALAPLLAAVVGVAPDGGVGFSALASAAQIEDERRAARRAELPWQVCDVTLVGACPFYLCILSKRCVQARLYARTYASLHRADGEFCFERW
jgi:hypothetical protein